MDATGTEVWSCTTCNPVLRSTTNTIESSENESTEATVGSHKRVHITGKEANTQQLDENLKQALNSWTAVNKSVDYAELGKYERDQEDGFQGHGLLDSEKFKLQLRPASSGLNSDN